MQEVMLKKARKVEPEISQTELKAIEEYKEAKKKGKLISHEQLLKELGVKCT